MFPPPQLSTHFSLAELTVSQEAARYGIDNTPCGATIDKLRSLAWHMEEVRSALGGLPILVSSGYRSPALNSRVGGSPTSSHCLGEAVDFICPAYGSNKDVIARLRATLPLWDQLILEFPKHSNGGWVHIGFGLKSRKTVTTTDDGKNYRNI